MNSGCQVLKSPEVINAKMNKYCVKCESSLCLRLLFVALVPLSETMLTLKVPEVGFHCFTINKSILPDEHTQMSAHQL